MPPRITALKARRGGGVLVQIDGNDWRVLPADVVVRARLTPGTELDRPRLREVARERRRAEALAAAGECSAPATCLRKPSMHDSSEGASRQPTGRGPSLRWRMPGSSTTRGSRAIARWRSPAGVSATLRSASTWNESVWRRSSWTTRSPALEPEADRARRIIASRGRSHATARFLARKGFGEDAVESAAGEVLG